MSLLPTRLRQAALIAATLFYALAPSGGSAVTAAAIGVTAATIISASNAEARPKVRDHRSHCGGPRGGRHCGG